MKQTIVNEEPPDERDGSTAEAGLYGDEGLP